MIFHADPDYYDYDDDPEEDEGNIQTLDLGACCACGKEDVTVRNILALRQKAPVPGSGWGCVVCGLPMDGAMAVVCDACLQVSAPLKMAIFDNAAKKMRISYSRLSGEHEHDWIKHPEAGKRAR